MDFSGRTPLMSACASRTWDLRCAVLCVLAHLRAPGVDLSPGGEDGGALLRYLGNRQASPIAREAVQLEVGIFIVSLFPEQRARTLQVT
jgi:hypothetical protein